MRKTKNSLWLGSQACGFTEKEVPSLKERERGRSRERGRGEREERERESHSG